MSEFEKELAVLKGRVDGLEQRLGELEYLPRKISSSAVLLIDQYDIESQTIKKTAKAVQANNASNSGIWSRLSVDDSVIFTAYDQLIHIEDSNTSGNWPTKNVKYYTRLTLTGKDYSLYGQAYDGKYFRNPGVIPTAQGSLFIINRQVV